MKSGIDYIGVSVIPMCHDGDGNYLLSLRGPGVRDEQHRWEPAGGGGVEYGETLEDALAREIREEVGATAFNFELLGTREVFREHNGERTHWIAFDYRVQIDPNEVRILEPHKCEELRWCAVSEIPEPQHSQFPFFLEKYKQML